MAQEPFLRFVLGIGAEPNFYALCAEQEIRRDLAWALCCSNAERIQTLHIPMSDTSRYLSLIPRLKVLADVVFQIDRNIIPPLHLDRASSDVSERWTRLKEDRTRHMEEMVLFVQEHQRHHHKVIQTARCLNDRVQEDSCPFEYKVRLFQSLPPLPKPKHLDNSNWVQFAAHISETDVSFIKNISLMNVPTMAFDFDRIMRQEPFLHRCRSLEQFSLTTSSENIFKLAVEERRTFDAAIATEAATAKASFAGGDGAVVSQ